MMLMMALLFGDVRNRLKLLDYIGHISAHNSDRQTQTSPAFCVSTIPHHVESMINPTGIELSRELLKEGQPCGGLSS